MSELTWLSPFQHPHIHKCLEDKFTQFLCVHCSRARWTLFELALLYGCIRLVGIRSFFSQRWIHSVVGSQSRYRLRTWPRQAKLWAPIGKKSMSLGCGRWMDARELAGDQNTCQTKAWSTDSRVTECSFQGYKDQCETCWTHIQPSQVFKLH